GAGAGFTANLFIAGTDVLLSGISTEAAAILDDTMVVTPVDDWFFSIVSVFVLTLVGGLVTTRVIEQRLGKYIGYTVKEADRNYNPNAKKGFINAAVAGTIYLGIIAIVLFLPNSPLRSEDGKIVPSPFLDGIVPILLIFFIIIGVAFGMTVGK